MTFNMLPFLLGFVLDLLFGDPPGIPHIVRLFGLIIRKLENVIRPQHVTSSLDLRRRGIIFTFSAILITLWLGSAVLSVNFGYFAWLRVIVEALIIWQLLAANSLYRESSQVFYRLQDNDIEGARKALSMIVPRTRGNLDRNGIIELPSTVQNTADGSIAPLFYIMLGGPLLGLVYKMINTMDSMVGYRNSHYLHFGRAAARLDDVANFIPSRLAALLIVAASALCRLDTKQSWRIFRRDRRNHLSPNSAQTEAAVAGALGIRLAGPSKYGGTVVDKPYIGDATRPIEADDIMRANLLMIVSTFLMFALVIIWRW